MVTVDFRTRFAGDAIALDPDGFVDRLTPPLLDERGTAAHRAALRLGLRPLTFDVEGELVTLDLGDDRVRARRGPVEDALIVALDRAAFSDLAQGVTSTFGTQMTGGAQVVAGNADTFLAWEPVLRYLIDGRPLYEPGTMELRDAAGAPLDLHRSFTLDDPAEEIGHFLAEAGFLHIRDVFTPEEMAAVSAELDAAVAAADRDDGSSWWARTEAGEWYAARILGFNQHSPTLRGLLNSDRFRMIPSFTDDDFVQRDPDVGDSAEGLLKKVGVVEGISDVSWHKDCSMGDHSRRCSSLTVGISVTGATRENGELGAVAGSHRANVVPLGVDGLDLPRLPLPTGTGDLTVHCSCTLHMSRPPVSAERRVVYTGFDLAPRAGDHHATLDPEEIRRQRAALNDATRRQQGRNDQSELLTSFEL